jgi:hypothetical protein
MTWRPSNYLLEGELDNTTPGKVTGWMRFAGLTEKVTIDLEGDFEPDIRGRKIGFKGGYPGKEGAAVEFMRGFATRQAGTAGHITAGWPPHSWTEFPYIEWHSIHNGRVVLYLEPYQVLVLDEPAEIAGAEPGSV